MLRSIGKQSGESVESVQLLLLDIITSPPIRERSTVISVSVCLSLCLCLFLRLFRTARPIFTNFYACYLWPWLGPLPAA